jgi:CheY-like chemotaxis protein
MILGLLNEILSLKEYEVFSFNNPHVCSLYNDNAESCENFIPCADILITDIIMPGINGIDLLEKQKERGCKMHQGNKAVISGALSLDHEKKISDMNVKYFQKPFEFSDIITWLDECEQRIDLSQEAGIKRKHDRTPSRIKIKYALPLYNKKFEGIVTNISKGGFCITTYDPIVKEETIVIDTELPTACQEATVRWVTILPDESFAAGLSCS